MEPGKYTIETFAREKGIKKQSALNLISKLKKKGMVMTSGGGKQKRVYTIYNKPQKPTNGFYDLVNRYSPDKLAPEYKHYTYGGYSVEHAIIDGILQEEVRVQEAIVYLFKHVTNWKRLFDLAKKRNVIQKVMKCYRKARKTVKCRRMPRRYYDKYARPRRPV